MTEDINIEKENRNKSRLLLTACFIIFCFFYFISYFHRVGIPGTIFNLLQTDFSASATQITMLGAVFLYIYAIMQVFAGILVDKLGAARIIFFGAAAMTIGSFGFAVAPNYPLLLSFRIIIALGSSLIYLSLVREIADIFSHKNFAIFVSVILIVGYAGGLTGTYPFERATEFMGWRNVILSLSIISAAVLGIFIYLLLTTLKRTTQSTSVSLSDISSAAGNVLTFPIYVAYFITFAVYFLVQSSIGKKLLEDCFAYPSDKAAGVTLVLVLASMTGSGISGFISRLINNRRKPLLIAGSILALSFSVLMILAIKGIAGKYVILPAYIMLGLSAVSIPAGTANIRELNIPRLTGTAIGLLNGGCYVTVAILITAAGSMIDLFGDYAVHTETSVKYPDNAYVAVLLMCTMVSIFSVLGSFLIRETFGRNISPGSGNPFKTAVSEA
jgi:MFS family permease